MSNEAYNKLDSTHVFERAGLGKAPFVVSGYGREIYQAVPGDSRWPIQPGAVCNYCGTAISNVCYIKSSDGRQFKVGSECVNKTGDAGLKKSLKNSPEYRAMKRDQAAALDKRKTEELKALLADESVLAKLRTTHWTHPDSINSSLP